MDNSELNKGTYWDNSYNPYGLFSESINNLVIRNRIVNGSVCDIFILPRKLSIILSVKGIILSGER